MEFGAPLTDGSGDAVLRFVWTNPENALANARKTLDTLTRVCYDKDVDTEPPQNNRRYERWLTRPTARPTSPTQRRPRIARCACGCRCTAVTTPAPAATADAAAAIMLLTRKFAAPTSTLSGGDGWLESQYTVMVSTKRTMSATQAVCFKVPTLEVPVTSTW